MLPPSLPPLREPAGEGKKDKRSLALGRLCTKRPRGPLTSSIGGRRTAPPPSAGCEGCRRSPGSARGSLCGPCRAPGRVTRRSSGEEAVGGPVPHRPPPGTPSGRSPQRSRSVCDSHFPAWCGSCFSCAGDGGGEEARPSAEAWGRCPRGPVLPS
uniref:Uncharacterized protein n=1 Tax=Rousettus aegyptiacus TaxID=9407 RepID=A0A7J8E8L0_ROUAE|nr:hypothetical protein HJG63_008221 [Rousettus aegyptiacus]